jgi:hypothetical protein
MLHPLLATLKHSLNKTPELSGLLCRDVVFSLLMFFVHTMYFITHKICVKHFFPPEFITIQDKEITQHIAFLYVSSSALKNRKNSEFRHNFARIIE